MILYKCKEWLDSPRRSPKGIGKSSPKKKALDSPHRSPNGIGKSSPKKKALDSPHRSPKKKALDSPHRSPKGIGKSSPKKKAMDSPKGIGKSSLKKKPLDSPHQYQNGTILAPQSGTGSSRSDERRPIHLGSGTTIPLRGIGRPIPKGSGTGQAPFKKKSYCQNISPETRRKIKEPAYRKRLDSATPPAVEAGTLLINNDFKFTSKIYSNFSKEITPKVYIERKGESTSSSEDEEITPKVYIERKGESTSSSEDEEITPNVYIERKGESAAVVKPSVNIKTVTLSMLENARDYESDDSSVHISYSTEDALTCEQWLQNPTVDPKTHKRLKITGPIYKRYETECGIIYFSFNDETVTLKDFKYEKLLGQGSYGKVKLYTKLSGKDKSAQYAIKSSVKIPTMMRELEILKRVRGLKHIVSIFYAFEHFTTRQRVYIAMQYCHKNLFDILQTAHLNQGVTRMLLYGILMGLENLHNKDVIYRDLKLENIMIDEKNHPVLIDFGLSKILEKRQRTATVCGTVEYMAPEMISRQLYDFSIDVWAYGILMYEMLYMSSPFESPKQILNNEPYIPLTSVNNENENGLLLDLLNKDPVSRIKISDIKKYPYFKGIRYRPNIPLYFD